MVQLIVLHFLCSQPFPLCVQCPGEENMPVNLGGLFNQEKTNQSHNVTQGQT